LEPDYPGGFTSRTASPLENIITALEEMAELSQLFEKSNDGDRPGS